MKARNAPTTKSVRKVSVTATGNRYGGGMGSRYATSGTTPARLKATKVAIPWRSAYGSWTPSPAAARAASSGRAEGELLAPLEDPSANRVAHPTISTTGGGRPAAAP